MIRHKGKVVWFDTERGWGFIKPDDSAIGGGKDLFTHFKYIVQRGFKALYDDDVVEFSLGENEKGVCAVEVKLLERANNVSSISN